MTRTSHDNNALVGAIAQGDAEYVLGKHSKFSQGGSVGFPIFVRVVVMEVISDPSIIDAAKVDHWEHNLGVANPKYASVAPRNSIIAKRVLTTVAGGAAEKTMVLYPFFPPHLSLPCKPGEHVWALFENPDAKINELGYWICRIVSPNFVEDVNYTHANREFDGSFKPGTIDQAEGNDDAKYEFPNGAIDEKDGERFVVGSTATLVPSTEEFDIEKVYEQVLQETDAGKMMQYEAVPRYRKRPGDIAFEGTNNTLIVLGTDRTGPVAQYDEDPDKGKSPKPVEEDMSDGAGEIDLVAGRGQTKDTLGKAVENKIGKKELAKHKKEIAEKEGDPDFKNDRSRILIAMKTKPDTNFKTDKVIQKHTLKKPVKDADKGGGAIVIKSDKVRLIARHDVVILVTGATETDDEGRVKDPDIDPDKCASIILRTNGAIILTPSKDNVLKLGGDDADKAVLCTRINNQGTGGKVTASPIVDTMAGAQGAADGLNGTFAEKVLMK